MTDEVLDTFQTLLPILRRRLGETAIDNLPNGVQPSTEFINDLNADSLDMVELVMDIEDVFNIEISDEHFEEVRSVADAVILIDTTLALKRKGETINGQ